MKRIYLPLSRFLRRALPRLRPYWFHFLTGLRFFRMGRMNKVYGVENIHLGNKVSIGDFCWLEAVDRYGSQQFTPLLELRSGTSLSDAVHISAATRIVIGENCLLGSRIYIGDHSHGAGRPDPASLQVPPGQRALANIAAIDIGANCWICDGAVILAGCRIHSGSVIAANAVVRLQTDEPALIAGNPAKVIHYFR
ncbi:acyltransferase [Chromobacterium sphagni]|nr:acyltransferase [Chromobacterium sphagni]